MDKFNYKTGAPTKPTDKLAGSLTTQRDIYDQWLKFVTGHLYEYNLTTGFPKNAAFEIKARCRSAEGFTIARFTTLGGKCQLDRAASEIGKDLQDRYALYLSLNGDIELSQFGRTQVCNPVSFTLISASEPVSHKKLGDNDTLCFLMPRDFVDQRIVSGESICTRVITAKDGIGHLAYQTLLAFQQDALLMEESQFQNAACFVGDLILLSLSGADHKSGQHSVRASNLARVKRVVRQRLTNPDLTLNDIAREAGLSLNYVHKLFKDDGRTMAEFLKAERLQRARRLLESPQAMATTVTDVSLACGFSNMAHFSTAFRRAFAIRPSDLLRRSK